LYFAPALDADLETADFAAPDFKIDDFEADDLAADDFAAEGATRNGVPFVLAGAAFLLAVEAGCAATAAANHSAAIDTARERKLVTVL
jgi:hypothetical protein